MKQHDCPSAGHKSQPPNKVVSVLKIATRTHIQQENGAHAQNGAAAELSLEQPFAYRMMGSRLTLPNALATISRSRRLKKHVTRHRVKRSTGQSRVTGVHVTVRAVMTGGNRGQSYVGAVLVLLFLTQTVLLTQKEHSRR
jgi:hypothetical protein